MSALKYQSDEYLQNQASYCRSRMNEYKMKAEACEAELEKRRCTITHKPHNQGEKL